RVLLDERLAARDLLLLFSQDRPEGRDILVVGATRRELRERRLEQRAHLEDVFDVVRACQRRERTEQRVGRGDAHEGAAARTRFGDAEKLQRTERFAHRGTRHLKLLRENALRWQLIAGL